MSLIQAETRRTYTAQRGVSQGASVTLVSVSGGYEARMNCATRCALVLGDRNLTKDFGFPSLFVPTEDICRALTALTETFSVALVDTVTDDAGTRFVLVWKINPRGSATSQPSDPVPAAEPDPNQGNLNLDEY